MASKTKAPKKFAAIRILFDSATSEFFWFGSDDDGQLTVVDSDSYSNESYAREAAAEYLHVEPSEVHVADEPNPSPEELDSA
jgi:hypothetical protein